MTPLRMQRYMINGKCHRCWGTAMGTWGTGPLDNDAAAAWCVMLDDAAPDERPTLIRQPLTAAANQDPSVYLDSDLASEAVAAAVVVASLLPDGLPLISDALAF